MMCFKVYLIGQFLDCSWGWVVLLVWNE